MYPLVGWSAGRLVGPDPRARAQAWLYGGVRGQGSGVGARALRAYVGQAPPSPQAQPVVRAARPIAPRPTRLPQPLSPPPEENVVVTERTGGDVKEVAWFDLSTLRRSLTLNVLLVGIATGAVFAIGSAIGSGIVQWVQGRQKSR